MRLCTKGFIWALAGLLALHPLAGALGEAAPAVAGTSAPAVQSGEDQTTTITAIGSADIYLTPDVAVLVISINDVAPAIIEAQAEVAAKLEAIMGDLDDLGISRKNVYTIFYNVDSIYSYQYGKLGDTESVSSYKVENQVAVYVSEAERIGEIIEIAQKNGAEGDYQVTFESSGEQHAYDQAMEKAAQNALHKAKLLAEAAGLELGKMTDIRECGEGLEALSVPEAVPDVRELSSLHNLLKVRATVEVTYQAED